MSAKQYLRTIDLASFGQEDGFIRNQRRTCYNGIYPFKIFPDKQLESIRFAPITVFYGGNGSGKTTLLNIIAEKTGVLRHSPFSGSAFFADYVSMCRLDATFIPQNSRILTSDDVSDYLLTIRNLNNGIDTRRNELLADYTHRKYKELRFTGLADYDNWKEGYDAKRMSQSRFVKDRLMRNVDMFSNGETAMRYYTDRITENALYLVDEPENSLSVKLQLELQRYIADSARFYGCQFVIATHSPVFLALPNALIYDLDDVPVTTKPWTELENVRLFYEFFLAHQSEFQ